ncbi:MAG: protein-(glutamine-N5) methyltransferase, release factor-specific [Legionellales bacterium RIFCSPHIGHO2_12_FULL_42_9]|nr:MAG: protein-(glutamine-N5) methyltransferase, release factor-specific [Legionellales bacterium RIFCSPHIGHO2_12_FULL_42_9]
MGNPEQHRIDCEVLLAFVLHKPRTYLYTHPEHIVSAETLLQFNELIAKRHLGTPIAYLVGYREFWSLPLKVSEATLIPRPETELIVELTLKLLDSVEKAQILDLGTGCGAIALALAHEKPAWKIIACDNSAEALQVAQENAEKLHLSHIQFILSDWFTTIPAEKTFHAIVANPPYIASDDPHLDQGSLRYEPRSALCGGDDGLVALQQLIKQSLVRLEKNGLLLVEHGYLQKNAVSALLHDYGYKEVHCWQDWQGNDRISGGRRI